MITRILDTVPGARSGRGNLLAYVVALAALSQRVDVLSVIPEDWRPYVTTIGGVILALAGVGWTPPGSGDPPTRLDDIRNRPTDQHPTVPTRMDGMRRASVAALVALGLSGCGGDGEVVDASVPHVWVSGSVEAEGDIDLYPDGSGEQAGDLWVHGDIEAGAQLRVCLSDSGGEPVCGDVVVGASLRGHITAADPTTEVEVCYWAVDGAVSGCHVEEIVP